MRMRHFLVAAVLVAGCKKDKAAQPSPSPSPKAPASTAEQDALWKLAPDGATVGIVVSSAGIKAMEAGWVSVKKLIATAPDLAPVAAKLDAQLTKVFGSSNVTLADVGMAPGKGAGLFAFEGGGELVIIPVVDRDKFLAITKGTKGTAADTIDNHTCKTVQNVYACAKPADLLDRIGKAPMGDKLKLAGARGDIELAGAIPTKSGQGTPIAFAAVGQLDRGAVTVRGAVQGVPDVATSKLKASAKPAIDASRATGFAFLNLAPVIAGLPLPPEEIAPGVTIAGLAATIADPQTITVTPGSIVFDVRVPLTDPAPAQKLIDQCETLPPLQMLGAKLVNGACHVAVPQMQIEIDAWVEGKELRVGKKGGAPSTVTIAPSPIASELLQGEWAYAMFGRGTMLGEGVFPPVPMGALPDEAKMGIRGLMFVNEMALGVRADGDTVRFLLSLRTAWSNPDDVVAKLIAIDPEAVVTGKAAAQAKEIAAASPQSPFATDFKAGLSGVMIPAAAIGMLAAIAIPAFVSYQRKAEQLRDMEPPPVEPDVAP
jgi:hypothetical protein